MKVIEKKWGYEEIIVNEPEYCGKRLTVLQLEGPGFHFHETKKETFFVVEGAVEFHVSPGRDGKDEEVILLTPNAAILTLPPGIRHRFVGLEPVNRFYEFSTHDDPGDTIRG